VSAGMAGHCDGDVWDSSSTATVNDVGTGTMRGQGTVRGPGE
jgi:hypothetical protein